MNPNTANPTLSMSFIAGLLLLMSVFSVSAPKAGMSSQESPLDTVTLTQLEAAAYLSY